ncbi:MAG: helix-turn-helix transcriptional regulator [Clostridia bacterium]|nr:helix-turn-helix transcriptional regulator [Clostridia bacterium]
MIYEFSNFGIIQDYFTKSGENLSFYEHMHNAFEIFLVSEGETKVTINETEYILNAGEAALIFPNQIHSFCSVRSKHTYWIFSQELIKAFSSQVLYKAPANNKFTPSSAVIDMLFNTKENDSLLKKKGTLYSLLAEFDKTAEYIEKDRLNLRFLDRALDFVENNYKGDCSLTNASNKLGYSYTYISKHFQKSFGISFNSFVNQYRISKACYLLKNSDMSILECSIECGYASVYSFMRNFKSICSVTPSEYRERRLVIPLF